MNNQVELNNVESFYDEMGPKYSEIRKNQGLLFNDFIERPALRSLIQDSEYLRRKPITYILDIGCGPGVYTKDLAGSGKSVVAIDISKNMIDFAKEFCNDTLNIDSFNRIEFVHSSFENYDNKDLNFDLVLGTFMLSYFHNLDTLFKKVKDCLDNQGKFITSMLHPIRTFSTNESDGNSYTVKDYFSNGYYNSDFIDKDKLIHLKRWNIEDVANAAFNNGLLIEKIIEPKLSMSPPDHCDANRASFFQNNPSIIMFMMRKK